MANNRTNTRLILAAFATLLSLFWQSPVSAQRKSFTYAITSKPDQYGLLQLKVTNTSTKRITGLFLTHMCPAKDGRGAHGDTVGFDIFLVFSLDPRFRLSPGLLGTQSRSFDFLAEESACPFELGVLFEDQHCEMEPSDGSICAQMAVDRRATYAELTYVRGLVLGLKQEPEFSHRLFDAVEQRRLALASNSATGVSRDEIHARTRVIQNFVSAFRPGTAQSNLSTPDEVTKGIDSLLAEVSKGVAID